MVEVSGSDDVERRGLRAPIDAAVGGIMAGVLLSSFHSCGARSCAGLTNWPTKSCTSSTLTF